MHCSLSRAVHRCHCHYQPVYVYVCVCGCGCVWTASSALLHLFPPARFCLTNPSSINRHIRSSRLSIPTDLLSNSLPSTTTHPFVSSVSVIYRYPNPGVGIALSASQASKTEPASSTTLSAERRTPESRFKTKRYFSHLAPKQSSSTHTLPSLSPIGRFQSLGPELR